MPEAPAPPVAIDVHLPEPANLWIEASASLPGRDDALWFDPRVNDLGGLTRASGAVRRRSGKTPPTTLYLPPLRESPSADPDDSGIGSLVRSWCAEAGCEVRRHGIVGRDPLQHGYDVATSILDLLEVLVTRRNWDPTELPSGSTFIWPLIRGLTDAEELIEETLDRLSPRRPGCVVPILPDLSPRARRQLGAVAGDEVFEVVFHGGGVEPRKLAGACARRGIEFLARRPQPPAGRGDAFSTALAAELGLIADLLGATGGSAARAQAFYRAARWIEQTDHDLLSLLREGNLDVVPVLDETMRVVVEERASGAPRSGMLIELSERYAGGPVGGPVGGP